MLIAINPKLPMRNKILTQEYYLSLGVKVFGDNQFPDYLMMEMDQIHFFEFKAIYPKDNYGQVYIRTDNIEALYQSMLDSGIQIHPNGRLEIKPWGQKEFSLLDPDSNLLTFGQSI